MFTYKIIPYTLHFQFEAGTSRGILKEKKTWFIQLSHASFPNRFGWGECGLLPGLSPENEETFAADLEELSQFLLPKLEVSIKSWEKLSPRWMEDWKGKWLPSAWFGWETAWLDWVNGGNQLICDALFKSGDWQIPINGLVWMNPTVKMENQAKEKKLEGFNTIKIKIGALNWEEELALLSQLRMDMPHDQTNIRLDANGAWTFEEAIKKLDQLQAFGIESIEQPIAPGQLDSMADLCKKSPIPIALDEELIGKPFDHQKFNLLEKIDPQFIVLKPSLVGGLGQCNQWIKMAEDLGIGWWITSMLESNVGLNAIAQLTAQYRPTMAQGLGTGQIYKNNVSSPLEILSGELLYNPKKVWDFSTLSV